MCLPLAPSRPHIAVVAVLPPNSICCARGVVGPVTSEWIPCTSFRLVRGCPMCPYLQHCHTPWCVCRHTKWASHTRECFRHVGLPRVTSCCVGPYNFRAKLDAPLADGAGGGVHPRKRSPSAALHSFHLCPFTSPHNHLWAYGAMNNLIMII